jgi:hypothetical protein
VLARSANIGPSSLAISVTRRDAEPVTFSAGVALMAIFLLAGTDG